MACRYYNDEKSDPWSGIYCERIGGRPGVRYWNCYCDGDPSRCPKLGGDDPYELDMETVWKRKAEEERKRREEEERLRKERAYREEQERIRERERQEEQERQRRSREKSESERRKRDENTRNQNVIDLNQYRYEHSDDDIVHGGGTVRGGRYKGSSGDGMVKVILMMIGILVLFCGGWYAGAKTGLIKSTVTVSAKAPASGLIPVSEVSLRAVVQDGEHKDSVAQFDENGQCKLKLHSGMNAVYVEYDGTSVYLDSYLGNGFKQHAVDLNLDITERLMLRYLIIELQDGYGTALYPETVHVVDANGETITCKPVADGVYAMAFGNGALEETFTIAVDGYETLDLTADLSKRVSHMAITLSKK